MPSLFEIGPVVLEKKISNFVSLFSLFCYHLPLEKFMALHLNKFESLSHKNALCQVWFKLALWFCRRRFLNLVNVFYNYFPLEKGMALHLNKLEFPSPKEAFCLVWLKLVDWFWRKRWKCEKYTDGQSDDRRSEKITWAFSSGELKIFPIRKFQLIGILLIMFKRTLVLFWFTCIKAKQNQVQNNSWYIFSRNWGQWWSLVSHTAFFF